MLKIKEGESIHLTVLEKNLMERITPPMPKICPVSLRYEFAKYDADEVRRAYNKVYKLVATGKLEEV